MFVMSEVPLYFQVAVLCCVVGVHMSSLAKKQMPLLTKSFPQERRTAPGSYSRARCRGTLLIRNSPPPLGPPKDPR